MIVTCRNFPASVQRLSPNMSKALSQIISAKQSFASNCGRCFSQVAYDVADLDATEFGYRIVSPLEGRRYTATTPTFEFNEYEHPTHQFTSTTLDSYYSGSGLHDITVSEPLELLSDTEEAHKEWDEIIQAEGLHTAAHFEMLKEDPYLSDYEEMEEDWHQMDTNIPRRNCS